MFVYAVWGHVPIWFRGRKARFLGRVRFEVDAGQVRDVDEKVDMKYGAPYSAFPSTHWSGDWPLKLKSRYFCEFSSSITKSYHPSLHHGIGAPWSRAFVMVNIFGELPCCQSAEHSVRSNEVYGTHSKYLVIDQAQSTLILLNKLVRNGGLRLLNKSSN